MLTIYKQQNSAHTYLDNSWTLKCFQRIRVNFLKRSNTFSSHRMILMNTENWVEMCNFLFLIWCNFVSNFNVWNHIGKRRESVSRERKIESNRCFSVHLFFHFVASITVIKQAKQESNRSIVVTVMTLCISTAKPISYLTVAPVMFFFLLFTWFSSTFQFDLMCNAI